VTELLLIASLSTSPLPIRSKSSPGLYPVNQRSQHQSHCRAERFVPGDELGNGWGIPVVGLHEGATGSRGQQVAIPEGPEHLDMRVKWGPIGSRGNEARQR